MAKQLNHYSLATREISKWYKSCFAGWVILKNSCLQPYCHVDDRQCASRRGPVTALAIFTHLQTIITLLSSIMLIVIEIFVHLDDFASMLLTYFTYLDKIFPFLFESKHISFDLPLIFVQLSIEENTKLGWQSHPLSIIERSRKISECRLSLLRSTWWRSNYPIKQFISSRKIII